MDIDYKYKKNFVTQFNKLKAKYGEEMAALNGFSDDQLNFTTFTNNFIDTDVVADVSADPSSNVQHKDVRTLANEMPKSVRKLWSFNKVYYELNKRFDYKTANLWFEKEFTRALYMHDADTCTLKPYCYKGEEMLFVKYKNLQHYISFKELYNLIDEEEKFDITIGQVAKFPDDLYVLDIVNDKESFTKVTRVVKHNNEKKMRFIKYANGLSQIVTEDHPIITIEGDKPAKDVTMEDCVVTTPFRFFTNEKKSIKVEHKAHSNWKDCGEFILTKELGWLTGMILSEGSCSNSTLSLKQRNGEQLEKICYILDKYNFDFCEAVVENDVSTIILKTNPYVRWIKNFMEEQKSFSKALPSDYFTYDYEFLDGIIAGMIDGDGTIDGYKHRHCQIRINSEALCHQLSAYLGHRGIFCGDRIPFKYNYENSFKQNFPMFGIGFTLTNEDYFLNIGSIKINKLYEKRIRSGECSRKKYKYSYGIVPIIENSVYIDDCPVVYDITTETGHFICNGVVSHNCYAYTLKRLAEDGLFFIDGFNYQPAEHLITFIDFVKEFVSFNSNLTSGAVGLPDLVPYMYYFWKKDVDDMYVLRDPLYHAKQNIQRFIFAVNQPAVRDSIQSAFTNVNFFDEDYLMALFGGSTFPDGSFMVDELDGIMQFQKWFIEEIISTRHQNMFTYPVASISMIYKDHKFNNEEFAKDMIRYNMEWSDFNLFCSDSVTSLSNCCRLKSNIDDLGYFSSIGGTALRVGSVKVSTVNLARIAYESSNEKEFLIKLKDMVELDLKVLDVIRHIIKRNIEKGLLPNYCDGLIDLSTQYNTIGM